MERGEDGFRIGTVVQTHIITFEGFHERLCHSVGFGAAHRRETRDHALRVIVIDGVVRSVAAAVVGQLF